MEDEIFEQRTDLSKLNAAVEQIKATLAKIIVGQQDSIDLLIAGILADGHMLLEGVPGVAKTLTAKLLAKSIDAKYSRIQFTPDLMPSDILGTSVFNPKTTEFEFKQGPIFGNIILIDEINRAPAKTQSALFEVMEERQLTMDGKTYKMQEPFIVLATQNPIEQEGTYRLPEAQLDRFMFNLWVDYPKNDELKRIIKMTTAGAGEELNSVLTGKDVMEMRALVRKVPISDHVIDYIVRLVEATHPN